MADLECPVRTCGGHVAALDTEADGGRQGLE